MIAQLKGFIIEVTPESAVLDVNGVGYDIVCSLNTLSDLQANLVNGAGATTKLSKAVQVYTYTHVREDALQLFGFSTKTEKQLFTTLLKVNGIGPKMAINILSGASVDHLLSMIEAEDVKSLSKLPKVGKKTAEQMILTLKGKLVIQEAGEQKTGGPALGKNFSTSQREIASALVNLGFRSGDVDKVISQMPEGIDLQEGIRQGLSALGSV